MQVKLSGSPPSQLQSTLFLFSFSPPSGMSRGFWKNVISVNGSCLVATPLWVSVNVNVGYCWELEWSFCKIYFWYLWWSRKKQVGWFGLGFTPQKCIFWPPLNFGKLHQKEVKFDFGWGTWLTTFPKLRVAPQFRNLHLYFTDAYRRSPPCTLSQHPDSRETGVKDGNDPLNFPFRCFDYSS